MTEQNNHEEILEIDAEQLQELLDMETPDKLPPIVLSVEDYDIEQFDKGIKDTSYLAGQITALLNAGLSEGTVLDLLLSKDTIAHNIEIAKINKEMNLEVSKNAKAASDKYEL